MKSLRRRLVTTGAIAAAARQAPISACVVRLSEKTLLPHDVLARALADQAFMALLFLVRLRVSVITGHLVLRLQRLYPCAKAGGDCQLPLCCETM